MIFLKDIEKPFKERHIQYYSFKLFLDFFESLSPLDWFESSESGRRNCSLRDINHYYK